MTLRGREMSVGFRNDETGDGRQHESKLDAYAQDVSASAFAGFYDNHVDEVYRFVYRRCRDHELAEDITQETFLRAIRSVDDPNTISIGWLITVARNLLKDVMRRRSGYQHKVRLIGGRLSGQDEAADSKVVERLRVEAALEQLSVDYRLVLTLHYLDGFTVPALAEQMGRTVKSAEGLITRARRALRALLAEVATETSGAASHE